MPWCSAGTPICDLGPAQGRASSVVWGLGSAGRQWAVPAITPSSGPLCQLPFLKGHFLLQHRFNEVLVLFTLWGNRHTVLGEAGPAAAVQPSRDEEGPPQDRYHLGTRLHEGNPTSDSSASQLLAFDSPQIRAGEREPHRG